MGGRGAGSFTGYGASVLNRLEQVYETNKNGRSAYARNVAENANEAMKLAGTQKFADLVNDNRLARGINAINRVSDGFISKGLLDDWAQDYNRPLGISDNQWATVNERINYLHSQGYNNAEIAAIHQFYPDLVSTLRYRSGTYYPTR